MGRAPFDALGPPLAGAGSLDTNLGSNTVMLAAGGSRASGRNFFLGEGLFCVFRPFFGVFADAWRGGDCRRPAGGRSEKTVELARGAQISSPRARRRLGSRHDMPDTAGKWAG